MIAKNIKAQSFAGCVRYVMKKDAEVLKAEGECYNEFNIKQANQMKRLMSSCAKITPRDRISYCGRFSDHKGDQTLVVCVY